MYLDLHRRVYAIFKGEIMTEENKMETVAVSDLKAGDYVTVESWHEIIGGLTGKPHRDNSYVGEALEVLHAEGPFVIVKRQYYYMDKLLLDTRRLNLVRISKQYFDLLKREDRSE